MEAPAPNLNGGEGGRQRPPPARAMDNPSYRVYKNLRRFFESRGLEPAAAGKRSAAERGAHSREDGRTPFGK